MAVIYFFREKLGKIVDVVVGIVSRMQVVTPVSKAMEVLLRIMDADSTIVSQESRGQESFNNGYTMGSVNVKCTIFDKVDTKMVEIGLLLLDFVVGFYEICAASWMVCCDLIIA